MPRNLVLCLDGTSNRYSKANTNVVKLFGTLLRDAPEQLAYYQTGIGTNTPPGIYDRVVRRVVETLDKAFAILLDDHVLAAYDYLCQTWEPGDRIFIFGFSRGAYTARVVAAMVHKVGLLSRGNDELLPFAWDMFAHQRDPALWQGFRATFGREVPVDFLGVWDTVSSVGWAYSPQHYPFTMNNPCVRVLRHALALDERRAYFPQNEWTHEPPAWQDVQQVWFAGVHSDVGGGYPEAESGLAKITLRWMLGHAERAGLLLQPERVAAILPDRTGNGVAAPDPAAPAHQSLRGLWWLVELLPRRVRNPARDWRSEWVIPLGRHRRLREGAAIHESVFQRMADPAAQYRPTNLPERHTRVS
jgi:uncharacterized protein (DUF2235 family)